MPDTIPINPHEIVTAVCCAYGMDPAVMRSRRNNRRSVTVRRACAIRLRQAGLSYRDIGEFIGGRTHATVIGLLKGHS